eukprot:TRINITY_DN79256_c0_g1_i1.p2 TRINITY_DN79256_c0_g1~~TRINITY_DN79256_c0_g1_i1.p2  ORF type:complete len:103 (-),score=3.46 TRINITY_DN79256_c0_g1_i1:198-506(-)
MITSFKALAPHGALATGGEHMALMVLGVGSQASGPQRLQQPRPPLHQLRQQPLLQPPHHPLHQTPLFHGSVKEKETFTLHIPKGTVYISIFGQEEAQYQPTT